MLRGGSADKAGNSYEGYVAIQEICYLLKDSSDGYIYFEKPLEIDEGFEFEISKNGKVYYYQVKRELKRWTINRLEEILSNFLKKLNNNDNTICILFTTSNTDLDELIHRAEIAEDFKTFENIIKTQNYTDIFQSLYEKWKLKPREKEKAFNFLKSRIKIHLIDEKTLKINVNALLSNIFEEGADIIRPFIFEKVIISYNQRYTTKQIQDELSNEFKYLQLFRNNSIINKIDDINKKFENKMSLNNFFSKHRIKREEIIQEFINFKNDKTLKCFFISGEAGIGKSGALIDIIEKLKEENINYITINVDRLDPTNNLNKIGNELFEYNKSPAIIISNISQDKDCILIIDQLDAISTVSGRNPEFWDTIQDLIIQGLELKNLKLVICCRKFDLEKDNRINNFIRSNHYKSKFKEIHLKKLSNDQVQQKLTELGFGVSNITPKHLALYSLPINLSLLADIQEITKTTSIDYNSTIELYNKFWEIKQDNIRLRNPYFNVWTTTIFKLVDYLNSNHCLYAPKSIFYK